MQPCDGGCSAPRPAALRKDSTHDAVRHGCCLGCRVRMLHVFLLFPFDDVGSAIPPLQLRPVFGAVSSRVPPGDTMSRFVGFGDKNWGTPVFGVRNYSKRMTKRVIVFIEAYLAKRIVAGGFIGSCSCKSRGMRKRDKLKSRYWRLYLRPLEQRSLAIYQRYALGRLSACYQSCRRQGRALNRCGRRIEANEG